MKDNSLEFLAGPGKRTTLGRRRLLKSIRISRISGLLLIKIKMSHLELEAAALPKNFA